MENEGIKEKKLISSETQIVFTVKGFIATILTILGLFVGFHNLVIVPTLEQHKKEMENIQNKSDDRFENINNKLIEITNGLGVISGNVEGLNNRILDLKKPNSPVSGGSFSNEEN